MLMSQATITADDAPMPVFNYALTLTFGITTFNKPLDLELALALNRVLSDWNDGRYPICKELIDLGLSKCLADAQFQVCQKRAQEEYGNEMVDTGPGMRTGRWYIEAVKEYEAIKASSHFPYADTEVKAKIERVNTKEIK
jgi:hypothetical protein